MIYVYNKPIYFTKTNSLIKKIIKEQAWRYELPKEYITNSLDIFTHGFIIFGKSKKDLYIVKGFIIFIYDEFINFIQGKIVCSGKNYKGIGLQLLTKTKEFILNNKIHEWTIYSLPNEKLINFYENFGFIRGNIIIQTIMN